MKKYSLLPALLFSVCSAFAQNNNSNSILVRHDTTLLKAEECEWIIKSPAKNQPTAVLGKPISLMIMQAIESGKLKAFDWMTNKPIPAKKIMTWNMPADSMMVEDDKGNTKFTTVQRSHSSDKIDQVRIYQDWYYDIATGKIRSVIKWIEPMEQIYTSTGIMLGYAPLCRIYY